MSWQTVCPWAVTFQPRAKYVISHKADYIIMLELWDLKSQNSHHSSQVRVYNLKSTKTKVYRTYQSTKSTLFLLEILIELDVSTGNYTYILQVEQLTNINHEFCTTVADFIHLVLISKLKANSAKKMIPLNPGKERMRTYIVGFSYSTSKSFSWIEF